MKWRSLVFALIGLSFVASLFAEETKAIGGGQFGKESLESIDGTGLIKLNGTTVDNDVHVLGSLISQNGEMGSIHVNGEVSLTGTTVKNGGSVMGSFQAVRSKIEAPITILSQKTVITNSKLSGITIKKDSAYKGKQIIELRLGSIVDGPIHFESGKGEVLLFSNSQVLGPVTGGKIVKKN
jgi:hypothetical protein